MIGNKPLQDRSVLVLEDDFYLADDIAQALEGAGARVMGPFAEVPAARAEMSSAPPELAVLDVNLGAEMSFEIGRELQSRGIPLLFVTGYDARIIPPDLGAASYLTKPVNMAQLISVAASALRTEPNRT